METYKVEIVKTDQVDTRSPNIKNIDPAIVEEEIKLHQLAVQTVFKKLFEMGERQMEIHDYTKLKYLDGYVEALKTGKTGEEFYELKWWKEHLKERHHLYNRVPEDVNIIDLIEMIIDSVVAYKARNFTREFKDIKLPNDILQKVVKNTTDLILENLIVVDKDPSNDETFILGPVDGMEKE